MGLERLSQKMRNTKRVSRRRGWGGGVFRSRDKGGINTDMGEMEMW